MTALALGLVLGCSSAPTFVACVPGQCVCVRVCALSAVCVCRTAASLCPSTSSSTARNCRPARQTQVGGRGRGLLWQPIVLPSSSQQRAALSSHTTAPPPRFDAEGFIETEDYVELGGVRICKPFVEKPASGGWGLSAAGVSCRRWQQRRSRVLLVVVTPCWPLPCPCPAPSLPCLSQKSTVTCCTALPAVACR